MAKNEIVTLAGVFKNKLELQAYCDAQYKTLEEATNKIQSLEQEVKHLQDLLVKSSKLIADVKTVKLQVSTEQAICEMQIKMLKEQAMYRELTLEETKRLDLLVKNLYLIKEREANTINAEYAILDPQEEEKLIKIASSTDDAG